MKTTNQHLLLAVCIFGAAALSTELAVANDTTPAPAAPSCCAGGVAGCSMTTPMANNSTNAIPDLLTTCPVSGDKLDGDMGKPYVFTYKGQEVKLCCKSCKKKFDKDPEKYLKIIRAADQKTEQK